jgi:uncharacterized protein (TIGR02231 family)
MRPARFHFALVYSSLLALPQLAHADSVRVASRVDAATVFTSAVSIHRATRVRVGEGDHTITFAPLPVSLDDDSVRIGGFGPGAIADAVSVRTGRRGELMQGQLVELQSRLEAMQREYAQLGQRIGSLTVAQRNRQNVGNQIAETQARMEDLATRIAAQSAALQQARAEAEQPVKFVSVDVSTERAGDLDLTIEYMVPNGASWRPAYAAHLDDAEARLGLDVFAAVQQNTGEDWTDVRLSVSTVTPSSGLTLPQLAQADVALEPQEETDPITELSLRVRRAPTARPGAAMATDTAPATAAAPMPMRAPEGQNAPVAMRQAETRGQALAARIEIPDRVTIRSGATPRRILASHFEVDAGLEHQAAPSQSTAVYLVSRFTNHAAFPLLAGRVALFVGDQYVGVANLADVPIDEQVLLPFGADAGLAIERTLAHRNVQRAGGRDTTTQRYQFRLANHRDRAANVVVFDRLPVSQSHGLVVHPLATSRAPDSHHDGDAPGVVRWSMNVGGNATTRWEFGYTLDMPRGRVLAGELP